MICPEEKELFHLLCILEKQNEENIIKYKVSLETKEGIKNLNSTQTAKAIGTMIHVLLEYAKEKIPDALEIIKSKPIFIEEKLENNN